jgi:hypothetical protein
MSKSSLSVITSEIGRLPRRFRGAQRSVVGLQRQAFKLTKHRPGRSLLGAFAIGFAVSRLTKLVLV